MYLVFNFNESGVMSIILGTKKRPFVFWLYLLRFGHYEMFNHDAYADVVMTLFLSVMTLLCFLLGYFVAVKLCLVFCIYVLVTLFCVLMLLAGQLEAASCVK